jgi:hypothetical protein
MKGRFIAALLLWACTPVSKETSAVSLVVRVGTDDRRPLNGVAIRAGNRTLGQTGPDGVLQTRAAAAPGTALHLTAACPPDHQPAPPADRTVVVRHRRDRQTGRLYPLEAAFTCVPRQRTHVVIVRASPPCVLPVRVTGMPPLYTDPDGVAHVAVTGPPDQEIEIVLDTGDRPTLRPLMPRRRLRLPERSRFLVFDQVFTEEKPKKRAARRQSHPGPRRL